MSDAVFQRSQEVVRPSAAKRDRRLPRGYGLVIGAAASMGLWAGLIWMIADLLA